MNGAAARQAAFSRKHMTAHGRRPKPGTGKLPKRVDSGRYEWGLRIVTWAAAFAAFAALLLIICYVVAKGVPHIKPSLFALEYTSDNVSLFPAFVATVQITGLSLLIAVPLGICAAIYLAEYARRGNKAVVAIRLMTETLAGVPSIIFGLFGMLLFVTALGWRYSVLAGSCTLALMILPLVLRATEEALMAVPDAWREGAFGLGAGRLRMVMRIALPSAVPGILAGVILAIGRIVGETAALIYTSGTVAQIPGSAMESARTLSVHLYALSSEGLHTDEGYATAVVLLVLVVAINAVSAAVAKRVGVKNSGE